jgi:hypothetical protein
VETPSAPGALLCSRLSPRSVLGSVC